MIWKPLYSCSVVSEQLNNLNKIFPSNIESILLKEKSLDADSGTLHLLTALLTQLIKKMEFCHKRLKNNPPKESLAFFFGQVIFLYYFFFFFILLRYTRTAAQNKDTHVVDSSINCVHGFLLYI